MNSINSTMDNEHYRSFVSNIHKKDTRTTLQNFFEYLNTSGRICPKPWYWQRFFMMYKPRYEPCWLSSWWQTPIKDKKEIFRKQMFYLAYRTNRFQEAHQFLIGLDEENWLFE